MALYEAMQKSRNKLAGQLAPVEHPKPEGQEGQVTPGDQVAAEPQPRPEEPAAVVESRPVVESQPAVESQPEGQAGTAPVVEDRTPAGPPVRWQRPRRIQFNAGQLELTIPYPIAGAIVLALILIVLAAFRLGQRFGVH
jgi:hypothetical protein